MMGKCLLVFTIAILLAAVFIGRSPLFKLRKPLNAHYMKLHDIIPFEGNLKPNNKLTNAKHIALNKIHGPETIVFHNDGGMYTGLMNGWIVRIDEATDTVHKIVRIGDETSEEICNDLHGKFKLRGHPTCGTPLGLRFHPDRPDEMYVADAWYGVVKVDVKKGTKKVILDANDKRFSGLPMKFTDDLDIDGDMIYVCDASYAYDYNNAIDGIIEALPHGRLFSYNEKTDELDFIAGNLYFPNGVQLMPNKKEILVNENVYNRVLKIQLTGDKKGSKEIFAESPGFGDTIRMTDKQTLLVPFCLTRNTDIPSIFDLVGEYPLVRSFMAAIFDFDEFDRAGLTKHYGLIVEYDLNGKLLKSWHDPTGQTIEMSTNAVKHGDKLYIGNLYNNYVSVVDY